LPDVFIARQPIFDRKLEVTGYELLFRGANQNVAVISDHDEATSTVVINAFTEIGLETVVGERRAWINVSRDFLLGGFARALPRGRVVLELLEDQVIDDELLESLADHRAHGYEIALDDFAGNEHMLPALPHVDIVKVDLLGRDLATVADDLKRLARHDLTLLAEKVETREEHEWCLEHGFDLFQGYFFCKPERMEARSVAPSRLSMLQLVAALQDERIEIKQLETLVTRDVALSYRLLRYINSAFFGLRREVDSISRALMLLGTANVKRWATLSIFASVDEKPRELIETALVRARFCEIAGEGNKDQLFTLGLFSVVDALMDAPMEDVLASMPFPDEMRQALIKRTGPKGELLEVALSFERGEFVPPTHSFGSAYIEAMGWATSAADELFGAGAGLAVTA
jgi:EAL and modified HD-GYP domain-containing signal transduction protein